MKLNEPLHLPRWFWNDLGRLSAAVKGPIDPKFENQSRGERLGANVNSFLLHALAGVVLFFSLVGLMFQDSPRFDLPPMRFMSDVSSYLFLASLVGFPFIAIGSFLYAASGRVTRARKLCRLNLLMAVATFVSLIVPIMLAP